MIKVDISTALFVYLFFSVIVVLILWAFIDFGTKLRAYGPDEKFIWHCPICTYTYIDSKNQDISVCPRCKSYNQRVEVPRSVSNST